MRRIIYVFISSFCILCSCSKSDNANPSGSITASIDGTNVVFGTEAFALNQQNSGIYALIITGFQGAVNSSNQITIGIGGTSPVTTKTYTDVFDPSEDDEVSFVFTQQPGNITYGANGEAPNTATVTITSLTSSKVEGTFSGGVVLVSGSGSPASHTITNGRFNLSIRN